MDKPLIKICGIRDPEMATQVAVAGADFIGIIFHAPSPRHVTINQAATIVNATRNAGAKPVAIFVEQTASEMQHICETCNIDILELHGKTPRREHHLLPQDYQRIYAQVVSGKGEILKDQGLQKLDMDRDFILIDHVNPGMGNTIYQSGFHYDLPFRWFLAGGLKANNVVAAMNDLKPHGVNVSSGVESDRGMKDMFLVNEFIKCVRGYHAI